MKQTYDEKHFQVETMNVSRAWTRTLESLKQNTVGHLLLWGIPTILMLLGLLLLTGFFSPEQVDFVFLSVSLDLMESAPRWLVSGPGLYGLFLLVITVYSQIHVLQVAALSQDGPWSWTAVTRGLRGRLGRMYQTNGALALGFFAIYMLFMVLLMLLLFMLAGVDFSLAVLGSTVTGRVLVLLGALALGTLVIAPFYWVSKLPLLLPVQGSPAVRLGLDLFSRNRILTWILILPLVIIPIVVIFMAPIRETMNPSLHVTDMVNPLPWILLALGPLWYLLLVFEVQAIQGSVRPREETPAVAGTSETESAESPELDSP